MLGQTQNPAGIPELVKILSDLEEHPMVRHEAGEALGAIGTSECLAPLNAHKSDDSPEVRETCVLALQRIEEAARGHVQESRSDYVSVDPTPAASLTASLVQLKNSLVDEEATMFDRYRSLFALRNIGGSAAVDAIAQAFDSSSALLKHEVAFVLGQMQDKTAVPCLRRVLENMGENPMVRHEAAEALGSIAMDDCVELLKQYAKDPDPIVADSCLVALDMLEHEQSGAFEYVDTGVDETS